MNFFNKKLLFLLLSAILTTAIFVYLLKTVSLADVKQLLREIDLRFLLAFVILSLTGTAFRTWRYLLTLRPAGYSPPKLPLFLVALVRNMCSDLLPARIGSAVYIYLANTRLGIPVAVATNSFALSLLFDLVALGPLVAVALLFAGESFPISRLVLLTGALAAFAITMAVVWYLPVLARSSGYVFEHFPFFPERWKLALGKFSRQVGQECETTRRYGTYFNIFVASCFVRLCKYGSLYVFLVGMLLPLGFGIEEISPVVCTVGILAAEMAASLPVSGIAGFGAYEGAWAFTFALMGFPEDVAKLTAVAHHLFTQVWGYGLGLAALGFLMLPLFITTVTRVQLKQLNRPFDFFAQFALFLLSLTLSFSAFALPDLKQQNNRNVVIEPVPESARAELENLKHSLPGKLFFDSNRSGTFGIYSVNTDGTGLSVLVDDPHWHEVYPDISPDGTKLVYARTRSLTRQAPSEVWIAEINGRNGRKLSDAASFPTFDLDGNTVYLEIERKHVHALNLKTGEVRNIFPGKRKAFRGRQVIKPRISPDRSAVAMTVDNPSRWHAWWSPLGKQQGAAHKIAPGCEPAWFPDSNKLAVMKKTGARGGSGVMYFYKDSKKYGVLKDDPGPLGHEYFPTVTADGRFLLYSACPENQHDHITANYNIFVFDMNSRKTWQVTFDNSTNRWPKYAPYHVDQK